MDEAVVVNDIVIDIVFILKLLIIVLISICKLIRGFVLNKLVVMVVFMMLDFSQLLVNH